MDNDKKKLDDEEKEFFKKYQKSFLKSYWKLVTQELPPRSGTFWANILDECDVCSSYHQDRVYYSKPKNQWFADTMGSHGKVTHWGYPLPPPNDAM